MAQEKEFYKSPFPHPYVMDIKAMELKMAYVMLHDSERPKEMVFEFTRYHAFCFHARELLSCNIDLIAQGKPPHQYPPIKLPGKCPDDNQPWQEQE